MRQSFHLLTSILKLIVQLGRFLARITQFQLNQLSYIRQVVEKIFLKKIFMKKSRVKDNTNNLRNIETGIRSLHFLLLQTFHQQFYKVKTTMTKLNKI